MIKITFISNKNRIKKILTDPILWKLSGHLEDRDRYEVPDDKIYFGIYYNDLLIGVFEFSLLTYLTLIGHIQLLPKYHKTGTAVESVLAMKEFLKQNTAIKSIMTTVPEECKHVIKLMNKTGFNFIGILKNGINFHNITQDLILFQLEV